MQEDEEQTVGQMIDSLFKLVKTSQVQVVAGACKDGDVKVYRCGSIIRVDIKPKGDA